MSKFQEYPFAKTPKISESEKLVLLCKAKFNPVADQLIPNTRTLPK